MFHLPWHVLKQFLQSRNCAFLPGAMCRSTLRVLAQLHLQSCPPCVKFLSAMHKGQVVLSSIANCSLHVNALNMNCLRNCQRTFHHCRRVLWSTKECSPRQNLVNSFPTCLMSAWNRLLLWCIVVSAPTRFLRGRLLTHTDSLRTTVKSTQCKATATGCVRVSRCFRASFFPT